MQESSPTPLASVMMLTYNHEPYIRQAIESVLQQNTWFPFELIICDDCSTDGTRDVVRHFQDDPRVVLSFQPRNTEFAKNFSDGAQRIRGKYVAFCEGDDYWTSPNKLQRQVDFLEENPDFSICCHRVQMLFMGEQQPESKQFVYKDCRSDDERIRDGIFYADEAIANYYFQTGSLVLRWRFPGGLPPWFRKRMMFDHFMLMLHAVEGKIKYFDEAMSVWRRHNSGYSWLQTQDKGLFFQKEGEDWIKMYQNMDHFFYKRFHYQIRERVLLALRGMVANCLQTNAIDDLRQLIRTYEPLFLKPVLENAQLLDAVRLAFPENVEFAAPWALRGQAAVEETKLDEAEPGEAKTAKPDPAVGGLFALGLEDIPCCTDSVWNRWVGGKEHACFHNLRSALFAWLWEKGVSTLWLPAYLPPILENNRMKLQFKRKLYSVGPRLEPSADFVAEVRPGEAVLTICYMGRPLPAGLRKALAARQDILWIEDRAQALWTGENSRAHAVLYSPRKLAGVPDGGILVADGAAALHAKLDAHNFDANAVCMQQLLEHFEHPHGMTNAHILRQSKAEMERQVSLSRMSRTTETLLRRMSLKDMVQRRKRNWRILYEVLGQYCLWPLANPSFAPFGFPLRVPDSVTTEIVHTLLTKNNMHCQRIWHPLPLPPRLFPMEENLAQHLLLLPCGQCHSEEDMHRLAVATRDILQGKGCVSGLDSSNSFSVCN